MNQAIEEIQHFSANYGGTNILTPLTKAQHMLVDGYQEYNAWLTDYFEKN